MKIWTLRRAANVGAWKLALLPALLLAAFLAGCRASQSAAPADEAASSVASAEAEARGIADASLGKQAEILDRGDLAQNGREQLLVVNRLSDATGRVAGAGTKGTVIVSRAVVLEKSEGKWREIFRSDEHLKNPYGYLVAASSTGWQLVAGRDSSGALEMEFSRATIADAMNVHTGERGEAKSLPFVVRWNTKKNRYQAYDRSQKRYLNETTALETPQSILK
jgi:hypothetical protein